MTASLVVELPRILVWEYREKYMRHRYRHHRATTTERLALTAEERASFACTYLHTASLMAALRSRSKLGVMLLVVFWQNIE